MSWRAVSDDFRGTKRVASIIVCCALGLASCGYAVQAPQALSADPTMPAKRVMFVGDSLLMQASPVITSEFAAHQMPAVILNHAIGGWGLLTALDGPGTPSKPADLIGPWIAQENPDIVLVEFSGNYWPGQDGPNDYLSLAWISRWDAQAERLTQIVLAAGKKLYWVIPPPRSSIESSWYGLRELSIVEALAHPGIGLVDWWTPTTTNDEHWAIWIDVGDGKGFFPIRNLDGLHFTPQGTQRMAEWTLVGLRPEWDRPTSPTTTTTMSISTTTTTTTPPGP